MKLDYFWELTKHVNKYTESLMKINIFKVKENMGET